MDRAEDDREDGKEMIKMTEQTSEENWIDEAEKQRHFNLIDEMSQIEMAKLWRFAPSGHPYFDDRLPFYERFKKRFGKLGGMTPAISKSIG